MRIATLLVVLSITALSVKAQEAAPRFSGPTTYSRVMVYLVDNRRIEARDLVIENDRLTFAERRSETSHELVLSDVQLIRVGAGTRVLEYAAIGGGIMTLGAVLGVAQANASDLGEDVDATPIVLGFMVGGAFIGALIGSTSMKWRTLYVRGSRAASARLQRNGSVVGVRVAVGFSVPLPITRPAGALP